MEYSNPEIPEGINTTREHPLKEFLILSGGILGLLVGVVLLLLILSEQLVGFIPLELEQELADRIITPGKDTGEQQAYLEALAKELSRHMALPATLQVQIHYVDDDIQNAFATPGGHIFIHRGLLDIMPHENALSMVIAHEIAHLKHRHPLRAMGRGVVVGLFLSTISGISGDRLLSGFISSTGLITALSFSREQEQEADKSALQAVQQYYGHVSGAADLFTQLMNRVEEKGLNTPQFLSTHPSGTSRIESLESLAAEKNWDIDAPVTALPNKLEKPASDI